MDIFDHKSHEHIVFKWIYVFSHFSIQRLTNKLGGVLFCCPLNATLNTSTLTLYNFFFCISLLLIMNYWPLKNGGLLEVRRHQRVLYSIAYKYDLCFTFLFIYIIFNTSMLFCYTGYHIARNIIRLISFVISIRHQVPCTWLTRPFHLCILI